MDLRSSIALLAEMPVSGDRLLDILLTDRTNVGLDDDGGPTFWLVVADQFERRGIACARAVEQALLAIDSGADERSMRDLDMSDRDIRKRKAGMTALATRLRAPRPITRKVAKKPPASVVSPGDVYSFRLTTDGEPINPWLIDRLRSKLILGGWRALLILRTGRAYDWFPWATYARTELTTPTEPRLEDVVGSCLGLKDFVRCAVPRASHLRRLGGRKLGQLALDPSRTEYPNFGNQSYEYVVRVGLSFSPRLPPPGSLPVTSLLA
jgi:hypothetical protein